MKGIEAYKRNGSDKFTFAINPGNLGRFSAIDERTAESTMSFPYGTFAIVETENGEMKKLHQFYLGTEQSGIGQVKLLRTYP